MHVGRPSTEEGRICREKARILVAGGLDLGTRRAGITTAPLAVDAAPGFGLAETGSLVFPRKHISIVGVAL